jgi:hypothetical protein
MTTYCRYHCRAYGSHFTSLEAFDAHHEGSGETFKPCAFPNGHGLVELTGACKIGSKTVQAPVTVYQTNRASRASEYFRAA